MCQMCHGFSKKPQGRCFSPCSKEGCGVTEASDEVDELVALGVCVCVCVCACARARVRVRVRVRVCVCSGGEGR